MEREREKGGGREFFENRYFAIFSFVFCLIVWVSDRYIFGGFLGFIGILLLCFFIILLKLRFREGRWLV